MSEKHDAMWEADAGQYIEQQEAEIDKLRELEGEIVRLRDLLKRARDEIDMIYELYGGLLTGTDKMLAEIDRELDAKK